MTTRRRKILLVDDEPAVVDGLRKALHQFRAHWEVSTATSGVAALSMCEHGAFDAVICDARMPELAGDEVLARVADRWPTMLRVVLTGEVQQAMLERLQRYAHHFFRKPATAGALFDTIQQSLDAGERLGSPVARGLLARLRTMPALPATFEAIQRLDSVPDSTLEQYVAIIERDPVVCANVVRIVNSAWFGLSKSVTSVREAVRLLGLRPLRDVVLTSELYAGAGAQLASIRERAIERLAVAPKLVRALSVESLKDAFTTAAVLADVGDLVLLLGAPEELARCPPLTGSGAARLEAERTVFGVDHALLGGVVLVCWGLPGALAEAVSQHHARAEVFQERRDLCALLALTCQLQQLVAWPEDPELRARVEALAAIFGCEDVGSLTTLFRGRAA